MSDAQKSDKPLSFEVNEVINLKGYAFKVILVDYFTGVVSLKCITKTEAKHLMDSQASKGSE